jgi:D-galactarolactone cycloisomerase
VAQAAALHAIASLPPQPHTANPVPLQNEPVVEFDRNHNPLRDELLRGELVLGKDGRVPVPQRPGLGVEVDEDVLRRYIRPEEACEKIKHSTRRNKKTKKQE